MSTLVMALLIWVFGELVTIEYFQFLWKHRPLFAERLIPAVYIRTMPSEKIWDVIQLGCLFAWPMLLPLVASVHILGGFKQNTN